MIGYRSLDEKTHQYQFSNTWMLDQNKWQQQESPNLTSRGYQKTPHFADGQAAMIVAAGQPDLVAPTDQTINIYYDHATVPVTPDHPEDKAGLRYDDLNKFVTRTINYRDTTGKKVNGAPNGKSTYTQTAHFTRTAIVDKVTGKILGYDTNNDGQVDVTNGDYAWTPLDATFNAVDSKDPASLLATQVLISSPSVKNWLLILARHRP
ncbi:MAG: mucin-binding protein [Limosilactobacillus pontis]